MWDTKVCHRGADYLPVFGILFNFFVKRNWDLLAADLRNRENNHRLVLLVSGVVDQEVLPQVNHLLEGVPPGGNGHEVVEELRRGREVFKHEFLVSQRVENVLWGEKPSFSVVNLMKNTFIFSTCNIKISLLLRESCKIKYSKDFWFFLKKSLEINSLPMVYPTSSKLSISNRAIRGWNSLQMRK